MAKARAKPASEASMPGVSTATNAVMPITALDSRLNRADSQRLTVKDNDEIRARDTPNYSDLPPHIQ